MKKRLNPQQRKELLRALLNFLEVVTAYYERENKQAEDEFKNNEHPRDENGRFTSGAAAIAIKEDILKGCKTRKEMHDAAQNYYRENFQNKTIKIGEYGDIKFIRGAIGETRNKAKANLDVYKALPQLEEIIKKGKRKDEDPHHPRKKNDYKKFVRISQKVKIEGKERTAKAIIGITPKDEKHFYCLLLDPPEVKK